MFELMRYQYVYGILQFTSALRYLNYFSHFAFYPSSLPPSLPSLCLQFPSCFHSTPCNVSRGLFHLHNLPMLFIGGNTKGCCSSRYPFAEVQ